jgi:hypothetical protein
MTEYLRVCSETRRADFHQRCLVVVLNSSRPSLPTSVSWLWHALFCRGFLRCAKQQSYRRQYTALAIIEKKAIMRTRCHARHPTQNFLRRPVVRTLIERATPSRLSDTSRSTWVRLSCLLSLECLSMHDGRRTMQHTNVNSCCTADSTQPMRRQQQYNWAASTWNISAAACGDRIHRIRRAGKCLSGPFPSSTS